MPTEAARHRRRWLVIGAGAAGALVLAALLVPSSNRSATPQGPGATSEPAGLLARIRTLGGVPEAIRGQVFENARFRTPLVLALPRELTPDQERWYTNALRTSLLPPIPPVGQVREIQPDEFRYFLQSTELIQVFELPSRIGNAPLQYFRYTDKAGPHTVAQGASRGLKLAQREVVAIEYTNQYKVNPIGMGERDVFALTFSYKLTSTLPHTSPIPRTYKGQARVLKNPDTGLWQLEQLALEDPQPIEYLRLAAPDVLNAFRKQQAIDAEKAAQAERARQEADRIRREAEEQARLQRLERTRLANTPTKTVATYELTLTRPHPFMARVQWVTKTKLDITDVSFVVTSSDWTDNTDANCGKPGYGKCGQSTARTRDPQTVRFSEVSSIETGTGYVTGPYAKQPAILVRWRGSYGALEIPGESSELRTSFDQLNAAYSAWKAKYSDLQQR